jgi:hypothetical protein
MLEHIEIFLKQHETLSSFLLIYAIYTILKVIFFITGFQHIKKWWILIRKKKEASVEISPEEID